MSIPENQYPDYALLSAAAYQSAHPGTKIVRLSSTCFPLMTPQAATGRLAPSNTVVCALELPYNDPVNPFVHLFHPQHDNLQYRNGTATALGEGAESYTVQRTLRFLHESSLSQQVVISLALTDGPSESLPGWTPSSFRR